MKICSEYHNDTLTISLGKNFDLSVYKTFEQYYTQFFEKISQAIIDLSQTEFVDSSALGMLLLLKENLGDKLQTIQIINANEEVKQVFKIAQFHQLFDIR